MTQALALAVYDAGVISCSLPGITREGQWQLKMEG
jgi:hypothetical protein